MPQASARAPLVTGGSTATTMRASGGARVDARGVERGAAPERVGAVLDQLAVEFLPAEPRALIAADDGAKEGRREIGGVGLGRARG